MKLYGLLFEGVSRDKIIEGLISLMKSGSRTGNYFITLIQHLLYNTGLPWDRQEAFKYVDRYAKDFYETNANEFNKILSLDGVDDFKHLGRGTYGNAFLLGDKILKIEHGYGTNQFDSAARAAKAIEALYGREELGRIVPMIYDQGSFVYPPGSDNKFNWVIMERFETIKPNEFEKMKNLLWVVTSRLFQYGEQKEQTKNLDIYADWFKEIVESLGEELRLKSGWFQKLVDDIVKLKSKGITDFHAGNIGIRRVGPEGELVFFD